MNTSYLHIYLTRFQYEDLRQGKETALVTICDYILFLIVSDPVHMNSSVPEAMGSWSQQIECSRLKKKRGGGGASQIRTNNAISFS